MSCAMGGANAAEPRAVRAGPRRPPRAQDRRLALEILRGARVLDTPLARSYTRRTSRTQLMTTMRAREPHRFLREEVPTRVPLVTVRAGESFMIRIGAIDRQSGGVEVAP